MNYRGRRLRSSAAVRELVRETSLSPANLIYPLFVTHGEDVQNPIATLPGISQWSVDRAVHEAAAAAAEGIPAVLLFGIPAHKDAIGSHAWFDDAPVQRACRAIKAALPNTLVITDVCLCEYTDHGHCGVLNRERATLPQDYVLNDETLELIARSAVSHARAGADMVAPSGMIDGMVGAIRTALDAAGYELTPVLSYAVKYASAFYGPFRDAAGGTPAFGDRRSHQMDPRNVREALREAEADVREGADLLMVKPALAYLDVLRTVRDRFPAMPLVAYNVSGEYAMVKAAAVQGLVEERAAVLEILHGMRRAGADLIITYHARDAARWLRDA